MKKSDAEKKAEEKEAVKMVDFRKIGVINIEGKPEYIDFSKQLGNIIYNQSKDIGEADFAREMYKDGRIEINKERADIVMKYAETFSYPVRDAFIKAVEL